MPETAPVLYIGDLGDRAPHLHYFIQGLSPVKNKKSSLATDGHSPYHLKLHNNANVTISTVSADAAILPIPSQWFLYAENLDNQEIILKSDHVNIGSAKIHVVKKENAQKFDMVYVVAKNGDKYFVDFSEHAVSLIEVNALNFGKSHLDLATYLEPDSNPYIDIKSSQSIKLKNVSVFSFKFIQKMTDSIDKNSSQYLKFKAELAEIISKKGHDFLMKKYSLHFEPAEKRYVLVKKDVDLESSLPALFVIDRTDFKAVR